MLRAAGFVRHPVALRRQNQGPSRKILPDGLQSHTMQAVSIFRDTSFDSNKLHLFIILPTLSLSCIKSSELHSSFNALKCLQLYEFKDLCWLLHP